MPSSGGSVSDAPVNKVVDGQSHYLAYITPDEGKSLKDQGGQEVITDSGIPAYPPLGQPGTSPGTRSDYSPGQGHRDTAPTSSRQPGLETSTSVAKQTTQQQDIKDLQTTMAGEGGATAQDYVNIYADPTISLDAKNETKENILTQIKNGTISKVKGWEIASKLGWLTNNSFVKAMGGAISMIANLGPEAQAKAMTWSLENKLKNIQNKKDFHPGAYGYKISDIQDDLEGIEKGTFTQNMYTAKYGSGDTTNPLDASYIHRPGGDNERALTNIITPYAAHAIGGTTQQPSVAAQWYANLGSGPSNPGAFNLTQQYAAAKAAVSKRLGSPTSVGQLAVNQSPFYNWLKDNSLNKGIL